MNGIGRRRGARTGFSRGEVVPREQESSSCTNKFFERRDGAREQESSSCTNKSFTRRGSAPPTQNVVRAWFVHQCRSLNQTQDRLSRSSALRSWCQRRHGRAFALGLPGER